MQLAWPTCFSRRDERVQSPEVGLGWKASKHSEEAQAAGVNQRRRKMRSEWTGPGFCGDLLPFSGLQLNNMEGQS